MTIDVNQYQQIYTRSICEYMLAISANFHHEYMSIYVCQYQQIYTSSICQFICFLISDKFNAVYMRLYTYIKYTSIIYHDK